MSQLLNSNHSSSYRVLRRNGKETDFNVDKIKNALTKAFVATEGDDGSRAQHIHDIVAKLTNQVWDALTRSRIEGAIFHIEDIQDQVELSLMREGHQKVARAYVLYREKRNQARPDSNQKTKIKSTGLSTITDDNKKIILDFAELKNICKDACHHLAGVSADIIYQEIKENLFDGMQQSKIIDVAIMVVKTMIDKNPNYGFVASRLLLNKARTGATGFLYGNNQQRKSNLEWQDFYKKYFKDYINKGCELNLLDSRLCSEYDLNVLSDAIDGNRDLNFNFLGLQTLYDRYLIHQGETRIELPQAFFMRVAMGLAINEINREQKTIEFYNLLSNFDFMCSTPTLFNSGTLRPQLSSCYLTTIPDDLQGIFEGITDDAMLSKFAGGLGNDWTQVRAMGSHIKGTNGKSQGVVPFLKVANDTAVAVNQCFATDTNVFIPDGICQISKIKKGDLVLGNSGNYREVTDTFTYNQKDKMLQINIEHSIKPLKITDGHPLYALQNVPLKQANHRTYDWLKKGKIKTQWTDAKNLKKGDFVAQVIPQEVVPVADFDCDDARMYGIMLGDGHLSKNGSEWGISFNPAKDKHIKFVESYLKTRNIHFYKHQRDANYCQLKWAAGCGVVRCATTGRFVEAGEDTMPFSYDDIYNKNHQKIIARKFNHLPPPQTLSLIHGLLETDGGISRGCEIYFTNTSESLAEGLRYQLLRLGVPSAGQYREHKNDHTATRVDGTKIEFKGITKAYDIRIPATAEIAPLVDCKVIKKQNWLKINNHIFSRIRDIKSIRPNSFVCDLKVEGDESYMTTSVLAHNGGKRKGAMCAYLETWHLDIEDFLELRKNTGDERRRTHDMNTANWIPDLFMKRVIEEKNWTLFSPEEVPELHDLYGDDFDKKYAEYEDKANQGKIKLFKTMPAVDLWRKMLGMLFETGHPWIAFKDPCNIRSPQQHSGVVHSSNLCTEITLNTNKDEIAVCNLGSINLPAHIDENGLNTKKLKKTIKTAMRMLDNVIDYNYYSVAKARNSNLKHRPVGIGLMGFNDALYKQKIPYCSQEAIDFADTSMEQISYNAIETSADLSVERGSYDSFAGSTWSRGEVPIDSLKDLKKYRGDYLQTDTGSKLDWDKLRQKVKNGMRNSNTMAIAPTATISNICGVSQSIEPTYQNLYVKSNLSGEFTVINPYLAKTLQENNLWDDLMINDLKFYDGSIQDIKRVPDNIKKLFPCAFEVDSRYLIEAAARRQKWIDQAISLNLYMEEASGKLLDNLYKLAWVRGLKTTYYLRSKGATGVEKSTEATAMNTESTTTNNETREPAACSILDPECEACQ
ncbi:MAG: ribonucleoside-diphosphate reductase subunit alpha [Gammaproteobacteria bacterium]|nr:MAG: ribonucleoside-diphosphate reductase subunit alpha [Gammaproteobacteria bacterium]